MERNISDVIVVGSGASGVHAAAVIAEAGCTVTMLDGGYRDETYAKLIPERSFFEIRRQDWQQHRYLLGDRFEGIDLSPVGAASHVTPPRQYILRDAARLTPSISSEFAALESLALGGLGGTWGAVSFPFTGYELTACGLAIDEMQPHYEAVARCIGVSGCKDDDLVPLRGELEALQPPLEVDTNALAILDTYRRKRELLHRAGAHVGRSLMAMLSQPLGSRRPNPYYDMDYWSNSGESVYRPDLTLRELLVRPNFSYQRSLVERFVETSTGQVKVFGRSVDKREMQSFEARALLLAAGALGTARIVLRSLGQFEVPVPLTCNSHTYVPCLIPRQLGRRLDPRRHSLAQLTMIYDPAGDRRHLVQAQYYPYRSLLSYRLLKESPLAYRESLRLLNALVPAFGIWLIQHEDFRGTRKFATLRGGSEGQDVLEIKFRLDDDQEHHQKLREKRMLQLLRRLGCWPLKRMHAIHGSSAHYGSTFPFSDEPRPLTTQPSGRLNQTRCIYIADGSSFRYLPAKGLTLTLMANARRVGAIVLQSLGRVSDAGSPVS
jgi:hypothetical protein